MSPEQYIQELNEIKADLEASPPVADSADDASALDRHLRKIAMVQEMIDRETPPPFTLICKQAIYGADDQIMRLLQRLNAVDL